MAAPVISVRNFRMVFDGRAVIRDLSFEVGSGEIFGFVGANGSGKTTTIRALLGIYEPTGGELLVNGTRFDPSHSQFLGYLPEERGLYKKESVIDTMVFFGRLKGMTKADARRWSEEYLASVDLGEKTNDKLGSLSGGQQQKVQFGVTIMNDPALLILDEPTKGLDPLNRRLMLDIIHERVANGATVILVTHQMEEVERLCDRMLLLKNGVSRLYGEIDEIRRSHGTEKVHLRFTGTLPENVALYAISGRAAGTAELTPAEGVDGQSILSFLVEQPNVNIQAFELRLPSIDDLFVDIYRERDL